MNISAISSWGKTFISRNSVDMCTMSLVFAGVLEWQSERLTKYKHTARNINKFTSLHDIQIYFVMEL